MDASNPVDVASDASEEDPAAMQFMYTGLEANQKSAWADLKPFGDDVQATSQSVKITDDQVLNSTGGYVYTVSDQIRIRRFLILGTSGGTYYASEKLLTLQNAKSILDMLEQGKGLQVLKELEEIDAANRAPKMSSLIFCLALVARNGDLESKKEAYKLLPKICRIPTHLFQFIGACEKANDGKSTGWGRLHRAAVGDWYLSKSLMSLIMAVTKYQKREGWSHRDVLRLSHPSIKKSKALKRKFDGTKKSDDDSFDEGAIQSNYNDVFLYCTKGFEYLLDRHTNFVEILKVAIEAKQPEPEKAKSESMEVDAKKEEKNKKKASSKKPELAKDPSIKKRFTENAPNHLKFLQGVEDLKACKDEVEAIRLVKQFGLVREHVPSGLLSKIAVWRMLLEKMSMTAMIRNLAKMTSVGLLTKENNIESEMICKKLRDVNALKAARIHPFSVLLAQTVYKGGAGHIGKLTWDPNESICAALDDAFYASFVNVRPTNKRFLLALDVSGSMMAALQASAVTCRAATAALAMVTLRTEPVCEVVSFQEGLQVLNLEKKDSLQQIIQKISDLPFGGTDCSLPMLWAARNKKKFDCIIVYTDNETYHGDIHPSEAMNLYRKISGIADAKLIVVGMTATNFTIADPKDPNMMDIVGFDSAAPELIRNFVASGFEIDASSAGKPSEDEWALALDDD